MICPECKCEVPYPCWSYPSYGPWVTYKGLPVIQCGNIPKDQAIFFGCEAEACPSVDEKYDYDFTASETYYGE